MELGFTHLGFSGHMDSEIRMDLAAYNAEIGRLQDLYRGRMEILRGVELDLLYTPQGDEEAALLRQMEYLIGSVHYVEAGDGTLIAVDDSAERLTKGCERYFDGDYYRLARAYYELEAGVYDRLHCTFAGHFDLITRFNDDLHFLDESDNCGAVNRGRKAELYPNRFLLGKLKEMGGEILINSDAHHKDLLNGGFETAVRTALDSGFTHTNFLEHSADGKTVFRQVPLDAELQMHCTGAL